MANCVCGRVVEEGGVGFYESAVDGIGSGAETYDFVMLLFSFDGGKSEIVYLCRGCAKERRAVAVQAAAEWLKQKIAQEKSKASALPQRLLPRI